MAVVGLDGTALRGRRSERGPNRRPGHQSSLVIVSNRLPVTRGPHGWTRSNGGLVSAVAPVAAQRMSSWVGWDGAVGGDPASDPPPGDEIDLKPVALQPDEVAGYYDGYANATLWPLYHDSLRPSVLELGWWEAYHAVNERFADRVATVAPQGATVWVHDYHLHLVPELVRARRPDVTITFFLHIPFPPLQLARRLGQLAALVRGTLGADVVGFQTRSDAAHFLDAAAAVGFATGDGVVMTPDGRSVGVVVAPISVDVDSIERVALDPTTEERAEDLRAELTAGGRALVVSVERLDYTKGIVERLSALAQGLRAGQLDASRFTMVQIAVPSREGLAEYAATAQQVDQLVAEINSEFGADEPIIRHSTHSHDLEELIALYRAADVAVVTPLRDGMNLVAKEFVAARVDDDGVLVLSQFAGAAEELRGAVTVNPFDPESLVGGIQRALDMGPLERRRRMERMRRQVQDHDVRRWATHLVSAAEQPVLDLRQLAR